MLRVWVCVYFVRKTQSAVCQLRPRSLVDPMDVQTVSATASGLMHAGVRCSATGMPRCSSMSRCSYFSHSAARPHIVDIEVVLHELARSEGLRRVASKTGALEGSGSSEGSVSTRARSRGLAESVASAPLKSNICRNLVEPPSHDVALAPSQTRRASGHGEQPRAHRSTLCRWRRCLSKEPGEPNCLSRRAFRRESRESVHSVSCAVGGPNLPVSFSSNDRMPFWSQ